MTCRKLLIARLVGGWICLALLCVAAGNASESSSNSARSDTGASQVLYNGIRLPSPWPPEIRKMSRERPPTPPYLAAPPAVIPIDVGRQLFVDNFLIESSSLKRTYHKARYHANNPILKPDKPWELKLDPSRSTTPATSAMPFSDGVWYDPQDRRFKLWYMGSFLVNRCLATSQDGVHWEKPSLDVVPGTNIVFPGVCDTSTVWMDLSEPDAAKRFKMFREDGGRSGMGVYCSADGIHWESTNVRCGNAPSPTTFFWNPFRKVWVYSVRASNGSHGRYRRYWETPVPTENINWDSFTRPEVGPRSKGPMRLPLWVWADKLDRPYPGRNFQAEIYNLDAVAYESVMLGMFAMLRGEPTRERPKIKELVVGFSRDGFHWHRPDREPFIPISENLDAWNAGNIQSSGGCCLVVGDQIYFYVSGRKYILDDQGSRVGEYTTGLATLRRDGFASMDAAEREGSLTTRPIRFRGRHLFVNAAVDQGELRVEVLDQEGQVISGLSRDRCVPVRTDHTLQEIQWRGADLSTIDGRPVRFRFLLRSGSLYSFWVSPDTNGASHGYVAAGGPGFTGPTDTVGRDGLK